MNVSLVRIKLVSRALAIIAMVLTVSGCDKANSEIVETVIKPVKLFEISNSASSQYDSFIANIDATDRATLSFQVAGEIETISVKMGSMVKQGEVIASLDPTDYQLAYEARLAEYNLAKTAYTRAKQLNNKKLISVDTFDQTETQYKATEAALEQAKADLRYTHIKAPFDGVVSLTFSKENQFIGANQPVLNVINNHILDVQLTIPVSYAERYGLDHIENSEFSVVMDNHREMSIPAEFKEISTSPNTDTNSYSASLTIVRPTLVNLLPGMTGQVRLHNPVNGDSVSIMTTAWVTKEQNKGQLFRFDAATQTISLVDVELNEQGRIISGIAYGDLIVEAGVEQLVPGQHVKAWTKEGGI
ncbi:efflux RND transporter periplasmic adaptor subunit [Vibrio sp. TH_r3]|uniref:efflux RND transporter periplasmic adaptor subunit n=1 Tax=Vibrio sp. TH_r3 TaxID=3082084 RepID=UPI0029555F0D|nr:efflux RND transporter periplasmic adaptor subunit [Vibrio sp. TH_r3]MDV7104568.1 efflux RND transporter periplasmic adaptor subunit [Vibrio sp. TH_r3]